MPSRRRLTPDARRDDLLDRAQLLFAELPYGEVLMEDVAERGGVSRALLYRHFATKRDLFAGVYRRAADRLLAETEIDPDVSIADQIAHGLDAHIDFFIENRNTVLAANRALAGDAVIQAIITDELSELRRRLFHSSMATASNPELLSGVLQSWLVFVRVLSVEWLETQAFSRIELRSACMGALVGALSTGQ